MKKWISLVRPHQYIKNAFVFVGSIFVPIHDIRVFYLAIVLFFAFCLASSAVYISNDIFDLSSDRVHPIKRRRPIASGAISVGAAVPVAVLFAILSLGVSLNVSVQSFLLILLYYAINLAYSYGLKHVVIADVFLISAGFILRILVGTIGIGIPPSQWLLLTGLMLTLFLGFTKRRAEIFMVFGNGNTETHKIRKVLDDYTPVMLDQIIGISASCTILSYALYTVSADTIRIHHTTNLIYTIPFVIYGIFRYLFLIYNHARGNDAAMDFLKDSHLICVSVGWLIVTLAIVG